MLSIALVVFLINCSCFENIKKFFSERKIITKVHRILNYEETKLNELVSLPIEVEKTRGGWSMINLYECLKNEYPLYPYSYVSLRVMVHIADMMMNVPYRYFEIKDNLEFKDIIENLKKEIEDREFLRISREGCPFRDFIVEYKRNRKIPTNSIDYMLLNANEHKEEQYKFINLFPTILHFLLGKSTQIKIAEFDKIWEDKFDPKFNNLSYSLNELRISEIKTSEINIDEKYLESEDIFTKIKRIMKEEPMIISSGQRESMSEYDHIRYDLPNTYKYGMERDKLKRYQSEETANNPYLRGLVMAAFLRSIWAILELPQEKAIKDQMIEILRKGNNIKDISMLVDSTKLTEFNISSKYLIIMRYVLFNTKVSKSAKYNPNEETEYLNQIGVISFMIRKMVNVQRYTIKIENEDSKIFLSDLSKCSAVICNEVYNLNYSTDIIREKTMSNMINFEIIKVFIKTVKEYMNKESEQIKKDLSLLNLAEDSDKKNNLQIKKKKEEETLNDMIFTIAFIIGEYMSKCKEYSYSILESFTRSYIFDKVKMRKTYLREIIETSKMADLKTRIENEQKMRIIFMARCVMNDFGNKEETITYIMLTTTSVELLEVPNLDLDKKEWEIQKYKLNEKIKFKYDEILDIFELEITNRVIFKTKRFFLGFYFMKTYITNQLIEMISLHNSNINIFRNVTVFKIENENGTETNEDNDNKNETESSIAFLCIIKETGRFFAFLTKLFNEREILLNARILVLNNKTISIYREYLDFWKTADADDILKVDNGISKLCNLSKFYSLVSDYSLGDLTGVTFAKTDLVILEFGSSILEIQLLDDLSYIKLKKIISSIAIENGFNTNLDDIYGNI